MPLHAQAICCSHLPAASLRERVRLIEASHNAYFQSILTEHMPDWREVEAMINGPR
ncbi:MAG: hypothetical protein ISQ97_06425 [Flavobacteriales bacterium]|nr:hypothetical protein [Flavobacteriales bacterium]